MTTPRDYTFKYEGKNPLEKLHPREPYFFLRAQDTLSTQTVAFYAGLLKLESDKAQAAGDKDKATELLKQSLGVLRVAHTFADWQVDHKELVKLPD